MPAEKNISSFFCHYFFWCGQELSFMAICKKGHYAKEKHNALAAHRKEYTRKSQFHTKNWISYFEFVVTTRGKKVVLESHRNRIVTKEQEHIKAIWRKQPWLGWCSAWATSSNSAVLLFVPTRVCLEIAPPTQGTALCHTYTQREKTENTINYNK